jgi:ribose/xylose/arabinose/galactoside ABC-type transport system permease subunit
MNCIGKGLSRIFDLLRHNAIVPLFGLLFIICSFAFPTFFTGDNLGSLFRTASINGLLATGVTYVIICADIDISLGAVMAFSCCIVGWTTAAHLEFLGIILALLFGVLCGFLMTFMIVRLRMSSFIASLAFMQGVRGLVYITTNYEVLNLPDMAPWLKFIGRGEFLQVITVPAVILLIVVFATSYIFRRTNIGRSMYAVGGNIEAAKMMGLKVEWTKYFAHMMCSGLAALAGVVLTCRMGAVTSVTGNMAEMQAIAAAVLGGAQLTGGIGKISGTYFGVMFIATLTNFFNNLNGVNTYWQQVITGVLLVIVVLSQLVSKNSAFKKMRREEIERTKHHAETIS